MINPLPDPPAPVGTASSLPSPSCCAIDENPSRFSAAPMSLIAAGV